MPITSRPTRGRCFLAALALFAFGADMEIAQAQDIGTSPPPPGFVPQGQGAAGTVQYRRALRRYRYDPGARFELRNNRRRFCRNQPSRC